MTKKIARAGIIAALYIVITFLLQAISFGPIQLRVAEALAVLPILYIEAVPGVFAGVLIANIFGGLGLADIGFGSLISLLAAILTYLFRNNFLAYLSPIILNGFLVSAYLHLLFDLPYWEVALSINISQAIVIFGLGYPLIRYLKKLKNEMDFLR